MVLCVMVAAASAVGGVMAGNFAPTDSAAAALLLPDGSVGCEIVQPPQGLLSLRGGMVVGAVSFRCSSGYRPAGVRLSLEYRDPYGFGWGIVLDQANTTLSAGVYQAGTDCRPGLWALIPSFGTVPAGGGAQYLVMLGPPLIVRFEDCEVA